MRLLIRDDINNIGADELQHLIASLPEWRRQRALKFKHEQGRKECAVSFSMLSQCLLNDYGITDPLEFSYGEHGKPSLKGHPEIHFSISHCRNAVAVAVDERPVGVDVERIGRFSESVARYSMNDEELESIMDSDNQALQFVRLWTKKEAVLKLLGTGINDNMKTVLSSHDDIHVETHDNPGKGYIVSVAVER